MKLMIEMFCTQDRPYDLWCTCVSSVREELRQGNWCHECAHQQFDKTMEDVEKSQANLGGAQLPLKCVICRKPNSLEEFQLTAADEATQRLRWCLACCKLMEWSSASDGVKRSNDPNPPSSASSGIHSGLETYM